MTIAPTIPTPLAWMPEERAVFRIPEFVPTRQWVERHVRIPERDSAIPGPVNLDLTPYLRGMFDWFDDPAIETITIVSGTQLGKTLFLYGCLLSATCQRPGPCLLVMPTEPDAREIAATTLRNYVLACEPARDLLADGEESLTNESFTFRTCTWYFGWSNSARSLGRRAIRYVFCDEGSDYPPFVGQKSNPYRLAAGRLRTYRNTTGAKDVRASSPTTRDELHGQAWEGSDKRHFWAPCPACGAWQPLVQARLTWPHDESGHSLDPDTIREKDLARYLCRACSAPWDDARRLAAVREGRWAREGEEVVTPPGLVPRAATAEIIGTPRRPNSNHAGGQIGSLYSPFIRLSQLAAAWLEAQSDLGALQDYVQQQLGDFWEEIASEVAEEPLRKHKGTYLMGTAPRGVQVVTATVDVQRGYFVCECRGWGYGLESWVLDARVMQTERILHDFLLTKRFPRLDAEGAEPPPEKAAPLTIWLTLLDSGDQTEYVQDLVQRWGDIDVRLTKGWDRIFGGLKLKARPVLKNPRTKRAYRVKMIAFDFENTFWKDQAARLANVADAGPGYLHLPADLPEEWFRQFLSEVKVPERRRGRRGLSARPTWHWKPRHLHTPNHYWDCAVLQCVLTDEQILNLRRLSDPNAPPAPAPRRRVGRMGG